MPQFDRVIRLTVGQPGGDGVVIENLRMTFDIEKDPTDTTNKCKMLIYNLAPKTRRTIERADSICILEAGYKEDAGLKRIFVGAILHTTTRNEGADQVTELNLADGQIAIRDSVVSVGYAAGTNGQQIVSDIVGQMGLTLRIGPDVAFPDYSNGYSFAGYARDALNIICAAAGAEWSIQNNDLQIIMGGSTTGVRALVFSADSGLIGSPERIVKAPKKAHSTTSGKRRKKKKKEKPSKQAGWKIETLLAPTVNPGDAVRLESITVKGWFRVESMRHEGDTHGGDWKTKMELIAVFLDDDGTPDEKANEEAEDDE